MFTTNGYEIKVSDKKLYTIISVNEKTEVRYLFNVHSEDSKKVIDVILEHAELIDGPKMVTLFNEESLLDHIDKNWIYTPHHIESIQEYMKQVFKDIQEKKNTVSAIEDIKGLSIASDEDIIVRLSDNISRACKEYNLENPKLLYADYTPYVEQVRSAYDIGRVEPIDMDDFIAIASREFFSEFFTPGTSNLEEEAYACSTWEEFRDYIQTSVLNDKAQNVIARKDGYHALCLNGDSGPKMIISYSGACIKPILGATIDSSKNKELLQLVGEDFWEASWYELARVYETKRMAQEQEEISAYEKQIELLEKNIRQRKRVGYDMSDAEMTFPEIAAMYARMYGKELSPQTMSNTLKSALAKMEARFANTSTKFGDLICA